MTENKNRQPVAEIQIKEKDGVHQVYIFACPHCGDPTQVLTNQVNCQIFRHACHFVVAPPTPHTYSKEYRESVAKVFDKMLIPGKVSDTILSYMGELPRYIPTHPINPHLPKVMCDQLVASGQVLGCAKPFRFVRTPEGNFVEKCGYI